ncbi:MAG: adenosylmethionine--8-amino-7-oxononanoate transaminase [Solirubrobacterales bacterium]
MARPCNPAARRLTPHPQDRAALDRTYNPWINELAELDKQYLWHPFTQQRGWSDEDAPIIESALGCVLTDTEGRDYIDGVSSLWCNVHGHRHPTIDAAIRDQLDRVAHTTMLGLSHEPAIRLAQRLIEIAPDGLSRVFYSDSGSTATEIAVKIAYQHWQQAGQPQRTKFVALHDAYHGDTIGSVSVGGIDLFHETYRPLLFETLKAPPGDIEAMSAVLAQHGSEVAAVMIEPLVQGAAGMLMQPPGYLKAVRDLCDEHSTLLICDEVATGFGRTGKMFACQHEDVTPDLMCVAKGITGGYLPLAATLARASLYESFLGEHEDFRTFFHGHTYTGNPLACAAALASLDVFEDEQTLEHVAQLDPLLDELLAPIAEMPRVREIRRRGMMIGIELEGFEVADRSGHQVVLEARERGAVLRPLGDVVVLMPPLAISPNQLRELVGITAASINVVVSRQSGQEPAQSQAKVTV